MFKNRFVLVLGFVSLLLVSMVVSGFQKGNDSLKSDQEAASDFHQRHPGWTWAVRAPAAAASDYFQRHPELSRPAILGVAASDYFQRHPGLTVPADASADLSEYYFRQQSMKRTGSDFTDYHFRHSND